MSDHDNTLDKPSDSALVELVRRLPQVLTALGFIVTAVGSIVTALISYQNSAALLKNESKVETIKVQAGVTDNKLDQIHELTNSNLSKANEKILALEGLIKDLMLEMKSASIQKTDGLKKSIEDAGIPPIK